VALRLCLLLASSAALLCLAAVVGAAVWLAGLFAANFQLLCRLF